MSIDLGGNMIVAGIVNAEAVVVANPVVYTTAAEVLTQFNAAGAAPVYACRAWVTFDGQGGVTILGSGNVSSTTDNGTGDYTINFATAMPTANFTINITAKKSSTDTSGALCFVSSADTGLATGKRIRTFSSNSGGFTASDFPEVYASVFC